MKVTFKGYPLIFSRIKNLLRKDLKNLRLDNIINNQISRYFGYFVKSILLFASIILLGINLNAFIYPATEAKEIVAISPEDAESHFKFLDYLISINDYRSAKKELGVIINIFGDSTRASRYKETIDKYGKKPSEIRQEIGVLEQLIIEKKGYRDANLKLAVMYWQIYEDDKARFYLMKALELDPNFEDSKRFEEIVNGK